MLELREDGEHLQHHPPGGGAGVERLGRRLQRDIELVQLIGKLGELAHLAREPVNPVDQQQIDLALTRKLERRLEARPVERSSSWATIRQPSCEATNACSRSRCECSEVG
ncbi:MAG TPA: hypothetical protein VFJ93_05345 [Gaiellaceae bacterium]|nr:hypothetical protein [Gaiellaceae bacterium]